MERVEGGWVLRRVVIMRGILIVATEPEAARRRCILLSVREAVRAAREEEEEGGGRFAGNPFVMVDMMRNDARVQRKNTAGRKLGECKTR